MATFLHTADWQLGKPFSRVADAEQRARLKQQRLDSVRRIGDVVRARGAEFVVVAGDLFDSNRPTPATVSAACDAIAAIGVPVYVIPGNHDHGGPECVWDQPHFRGECRERAANLHVLLDEMPVATDGAILLPCPLHRRHTSSDPCRWIGDLDFATLDDRPRIVVAHGSTVDFSGETDDEDLSGQPNFIDLARLPMDELDYVALGDWHGFVHAGGKAWYAGSHETDRFPRPGQLTGRVACVTATRGGAPVVEALPHGRTLWLAHAQTFSDDGGPELLDRTLSSLTSGHGPQQSLLDLTLGGSLGLAAHARLDALLARWGARLLDLRLERGVTVAPTAEEIEALRRSSDPLIAHVADELVAGLAAGGGEAALTGTALALLHEFIRAEGGR
jgi:hypothetical protein